MNEDRIEKKSKGRNTKVNMAIILIVIVLISLPQIISFNKENGNVNEKNVTYFDDNDLKPRTNYTNLTDKDKEFINWFSLTYVPIRNDLVCISNAAKKENFSETQKCSKFLKEDSQRSISQIGQFNESLSMNNAISEYKKSLENYYIGGKDLEIGTKNRDISLMSNATEYIKVGNVHIRYLMDSLPKNVTPLSKNW